jgi:hypothetical protein
VKKTTQFALLLIAACAVSTGARAQKVYRCGATYSQIPCAGAVAVEADDTRSAAQKSQADKSIVRDTAVANTMEKTRLKEEAKAIAQSQAANERGSSSKAKAKGKTAATKLGDDAKKKTKKKKEAEFFTAQTAAEKKAEKTKPAQ